MAFSPARIATRQGTVLGARFALLLCFENFTWRWFLQSVADTAPAIHFHQTLLAILVLCFCWGADSPVSRGWRVCRRRRGPSGWPSPPHRRPATREKSHEMSELRIQAEQG